MMMIMMMILIRKGGSHRGAVANVLNCGIVESELEL